MKSSLCSLFITLSLLFIFPYQCVSARVSEGTGPLPDLEAFRETAENYQQKTTTQETKTPTQEQKPAINLQDYLGRYQADPSMVENLILDVFVEEDQLWIKPSHSPKSQLAAKTADSFVITAVNGQITFNRDAKGLVQSLTIAQSPASATKPLIAKKLTLPSPSLKGNTTFRLRGHPNARVVAVAGNFNDWNQSQVLCGKEGDVWVCRIDLAPGKYTYKFIIDGDWILDPANPDTEDDERGFTNSVQLIHRLVGELCERRAPDLVKDKIRLIYTIGNQQVVISEERPFRDPSAEWIVLEIAKLRYVRTRNEWQLYWKRASGKWWLYEPHSKSTTLAAMIEEIDVDSDGCFFG